MRNSIGDAPTTHSYNGFLDNYEVMNIGNTILLRHITYSVLRK